MSSPWAKGYSAANEALRSELEWLRAEIERLRAVEQAARAFIRQGLRLTPDGLIVIERNDRSDPHYRLCVALEAIEPLNLSATGRGLAPEQQPADKFLMASDGKPMGMGVVLTSIAVLAWFSLMMVMAGIAFG